jgi:adenosylhomocysteine nucleosidase
LKDQFAWLVSDTMLLRWIVQQYAREAAEGGMRNAVNALQRSVGSQTTEPGSSASPIGALLAPRQEPPVNDLPEQERNPTSGRTNAEGEFLPCDAAFIYALGVESGGLVDMLRGAETSRHAHGLERAGKLNGREVVIVEGGVGQTAAAAATREAIRFYQPRRVISAGFAGGLTDELRRGHVVIASEVANSAGERMEVGLKVDAQSLAGAKGIHIGRLLTVDRILREPEERRKLAEQHEAIACDMETFAVAKVCRELGVPLAAIRIVSDAVDDVLPREIELLLAQKSLAGKLGAATGAILKRFSAAKDLWKLREEALKASDRLAKFLVAMVGEGSRE